MALRARRALRAQRAMTGGYSFAISRHELPEACWDSDLVSRDETECACSTRWLAGVVGVIDAIRDRHLGEIEWAYPVQAGHVYGK